MATVKIRSGANEERDTRLAVSKAQDGDTIIVPNEKCAKIVRSSDKYLFVKIAN